MWIMLVASMARAGPSCSDVRLSAAAYHLEDVQLDEPSVRWVLDGFAFEFTCDDERVGFAFAAAPLTPPTISNETPCHTPAIPTRPRASSPR